MYKGNVKKVMDDAEKIARRLRETDATLTSLMHEYGCGYKLMMRTVRMQIPEKEWKLLRKKKLAQSLKLNRRDSKILMGIVAQKHRPVGSISVRHRHRRYGPNKELVRITKMPFIKIKEHGTRDECWMKLSVYNWTRANGPVPAGFYVVSKNGDTMDCRPKNLILANRETHILLNQQIFQGMCSRGAASLQIKIKSNPSIRERAIKSRMKTCRIRRMKKARALVKARKEAERAQKHEARLLQLARLEAEQKKMAERQMLEIYGPQVCVWECANCSAEYEQKARPEKCVKCGRFSFEKNVYRRKTG